MITEDTKAFADGIKSGTIKLYSEEDKIKFKCRACGGCCFHKEIIIGPHDVWMMMQSPMLQRAGITNTLHLFKKGMLTLIKGCNTHLPLALLGKNQAGMCLFLSPVMVRNEKDELEPMRNEDGSPRFLCALEENKPHLCRLWPLGRVKSAPAGENQSVADLMRDPKWKYMLNEGCAGFDTEEEILVGDWMSKSKVDVSCPEADWFNSVIMPKLLETKPGERWGEDDFKVISSILFNFDAFSVLQDRMGVPTHGLSWEKVKQIIEESVLVFSEKIERGERNGKVSTVSGGRRRKDPKAN